MCNVLQQHRCSDIHQVGHKRESNDSQHPLMGQTKRNIKALKTTAWNGTIYSNRLSKKAERGQEKTEEQTGEDSEQLCKCFFLTCHSVQPVFVLSRGQPDKHHLLPEMTDPREGQHKVPPTQQLDQWRLNLSQHGRRPERNICVNILGTYTKSN